MICPYCNLEMEPIELGGKTFCSNCGLTINNLSTTPISATNQIITNDSDTSSSEEVINSPTPQTEPTVDFETLKNDTQKTFIENVGDELSETTVSAPEEPLISQLNEVPATSSDIPTEVEEEINLSVKPQLETEMPVTENIETAPLVDENLQQINNQESEKILMNIISDETPKAELESNIEDSTNINDQSDNLSFDEKVKNIDQLGTAGILLDILSDDALEKENTQKKLALESATELLDKINVNPTEEIKETETTETSKNPNIDMDVEESTDKEQEVIGASEFKPQGAVKLKVNVLNKEEINPNINLELPAPEAELDLPLPQKDLPTPENLSETNLETPETTNIPEKVEPLITESPEPEKQIEETTPTENDSTNNDLKDLLNVKDNQNEAIFTDLPSMKKKTGEKPKPHHLTNYFSEIIEKETKSKQLKKKKNKTKRNLKIFALFFVVLILLAGLFFYIYRQEFLIADKNVNKTEEINSNELLPKEIPYGYQAKDNGAFDEGNKIFKIEYEFLGNKERVITFLREETDDPKKNLEAFTTSQVGKFQVKTVEETEYTFFDNGTIAWVDAKYFFSITPKGEYYKDLIEKMAISVR